MKKELGAADLWSTLAKQQTALAFPLPPEEDQKFTPQELEKLDTAIDNFYEGQELKRLLTPEQLREFQRQAVRQKRFARILGKFEWRDVFFGELLLRLLQLKVVGDVALKVWSLAGQAVSWMVEKLPQISS